MRLHQRLALPHRLGDEQLVDSLVSDLAADERAGITPTVRAPPARAAAATAPIIDTRPPPVTSSQPRTAIPAPTARGQRRGRAGMPSDEAQ